LSYRLLIRFYISFLRSDLKRRVKKSITGILQISSTLINTGFKNDFKNLTSLVSIATHIRLPNSFDIDMSLHRNIITANKMQHFFNLFIFTNALHVSGRSFPHHQEHITVHTASEVPWSSISSTVAASSSIV